MLGGRQVDVRRISGGYQADIRFCTKRGILDFAGPAQSDRPIAAVSLARIINRSRIRRLLLHLSIAYCLHPKLDQDTHQNTYRASAS